MTLELLKNELCELYEEREIDNIFQLVLEHVTGLNRLERLTASYELSTDQKHRIKIIISELKQAKPIQYILGYTWFFGEKFILNENVLIPRPETEELVEKAIQIIIKYGYKNVLDLGTGSGCIAISLAKNTKNTSISATDVSSKALEIAQKNAFEVLKTKEIQFFLSNILEDDLPISPQLIISNPPYISLNEINTMSKNVINYEPHLALFVENKDPLLFYKKIVKKGLEKGCKHFLFEIHEDRKPELIEEFKTETLDLKFHKDLQSKDRMLELKLNG